jgi:hypothetical protein
MRTVALLTLALSCSVFAQSSSPMREGNWEFTTKMNMGGMEMPPTKATQCITAAMLKDPQSAVPKGPGADCKLADYKLAGDTATYKMTCTQPMVMTITGQMKYAGTDAYTATAVVDASGMSMAWAIDAKRIGDVCLK